MTEQEYNMAEGVRRSDLWRMADSPEKFKYFLDHPVEQTPAMFFGSACHKMVLEPETMGMEYAVAPVCDRRTKEGKLIYETFMADNQGKAIISPDDAKVMADMEEQVRHCPLANDLLHCDGQTEVPLFWEDPDTGEKCKAKLDRLIRDDDGRYMIVDYKTAASCETGKFNSEIFKLGYHFQAGFYASGLRMVMGLDYYPRFILIAQEKKPPYAVNVIELTEEVIGVGVAKYHELLDKYHACKMVDMWPGYVDGDMPNEAYIPGWMEFEEAGE